jgi:hypothetical protein
MSRSPSTAVRSCIVEISPRRRRQGSRSSSRESLNRRSRSVPSDESPGSRARSRSATGVESPRRRKFQRRSRRKRRSSLEGSTRRTDRRGSGSSSRRSLSPSPRRDGVTRNKSRVSQFDSETDENDNNRSFPDKDDEVVELRRKVQVLEKAVKDHEVIQKWVSDSMETISAKVDDLVVKIGAKIDVRECKNCGYAEILRKLMAIEKYLSVEKSVATLESTVKEIKDFCKVSEAVPRVMEDDLDEVFRKCLSVKDIENRFSELEYDVVEGKMMCDTCKKKAASYGDEQEDDFHGKIQSSEFRNLKKVLKSHLNSPGHKKHSKENDVEVKKEEKIQGRERKIGLILGNLAFI